jgi:hypothetical protein
MLADGICQLGQRLLRKMFSGLVSVRLNFVYWKRYGTVIGVVVYKEGIQTLAQPSQPCLCDDKNLPFTCFPEKMLSLPSPFCFCFPDFLRSSSPHKGKSVSGYPVFQRRHPGLQLGNLPLHLLILPLQLPLLFMGQLVAVKKRIDAPFVNSFSILMLRRVSNSSIRLAVRNSDCSISSAIWLNNS